MKRETWSKRRERRTGAGAAAERGGCRDHRTSETASNISKMSAEGEEELLDYSDSEEVNNQQQAEGGDAAVKSEETDKKGSYVGIHTTGFRDFLLKPELLRAIADCGFEHPSEG